MRLGRRGVRRGLGWYVAVAENSLQGTILAAFYRDQRIIRAFSIGGYGDAFYVLA